MLQNEENFIEFVLIGSVVSIIIILLIIAIW